MNILESILAILLTICLSNIIVCITYVFVLATYYLIRHMKKCDEHGW